MASDSTILIADDHPYMREALQALLANAGYRLEFAANGVEALEMARQLMPDLVLLDVMMPGMDGFDVCQHLRADARLADVPIVMITALDDQASRVRGLEAGADDFLSKPFVSAELRARVRSTIRLNRFRRLLGERERYQQLVELSPDGLALVDGNGVIRLANAALARLADVASAADLVGGRLRDLVPDEDQPRVVDARSLLAQVEGTTSGVELWLKRPNQPPVPVEVRAGRVDWAGQTQFQVIFRDISERRAAELALRRAHNELTDAYDTTLEGWSRALDFRDRETEGHSHRVTDLTVRLAHDFGVPAADIVHIRRGALLHDIGKIGVSDAILLKDGTLTQEEWQIMQQHPARALELLSPIEFLRPALDIPYCHHERWDGTGYPRGLRGEQIPLAARLFAVVDVWDALLSDRPYRPAWRQDRVLEHIKASAGSHFDPAVVDAFVRMIAQEREAP